MYKITNICKYYYLSYKNYFHNLNIKIIQKKDATY